MTNANKRYYIITAVPPFVELSLLVAHLFATLSPAYGPTIYYFPKYFVFFWHCARMTLWSSRRVAALGETNNSADHFVLVVSTFDN